MPSFWRDVSHSRSKATVATDTVSSLLIDELVEVDIVRVNLGRVAGVGVGAGGGWHHERRAGWRGGGTSRVRVVEVEEELVETLRVLVVAGRRVHG